MNEKNNSALDDVLIEVSCAGCGKVAFVLPLNAGATHSVICPECKERTYVRIDSHLGVAICNEKEVDARFKKWVFYARQALAKNIIKCNCGNKITKNTFGFSRKALNGVLAWSACESVINQHSGTRAVDLLETDDFILEEADSDLPVPRPRRESRW